MAWTIRIDARALRDLKRLDRTIQKEIANYLRHRIETARDPRDFGKPLRRDKFGLWCYRVGDYRVLCDIKDRELVVLVVEIGHRSTIYED